MDIRDNNGILLGTIKEEGGKQVGRNKNGGRVGIYDPDEDITRNNNGIKVGTGNQLATLIQEAN